MEFDPAAESILSAAVLIVVTLFHPPFVLTQMANDERPRASDDIFKRLPISAAHVRKSTIILFTLKMARLSQLIYSTAKSIVPLWRLSKNTSTPYQCT